MYGIFFKNHILFKYARRREYIWYTGVSIKIWELFMYTETYSDAQNMQAGLSEKKFVIEQTQTENMLPQKQGIESQQKSFKDQISLLTTQKTQLTDSHTKTVNSLQYQISSAKKQLTGLENQQPLTLEIEQQKEELTSKIKNLQAQLSSENLNYQDQLN